jgi:hypothetical protein
MKFIHAFLAVLSLATAAIASDERPALISETPELTSEPEQQPARIVQDIRLAKTSSLYLAVGFNVPYSLKSANTWAYDTKLIDQTTWRARSTWLDSSLYASNNLITHTIAQYNAYAALALTLAENCLTPQGTFKIPSGQDVVSRLKAISVKDILLYASVLYIAGQPHLEKLIPTITMRNAATTAFGLSFLAHLLLVGYDWVKTKAKPE